MVYVGILFGYGEVLLNGGEGFSNFVGGFGGCIVLYIIDRIFFKGVFIIYGGCGIICVVVGIIFICEYVVGLF